MTCANDSHALSESNVERTGSGKVVLYHGSKSGVEGAIKPISRRLCDFGRGFYMGTEKTQALALICNFPNARIYTIEADLTGLRTLNMETGMDWAMLIAYHRGKMERVSGSSIYQKYASLSNGHDMIVGDIANDRMFVVLDRFFSGEISDTALIGSLSVLKLGKQYVALTPMACRQIALVEERAVGEEERKLLRIESEASRREGIRKAEEICKRHRRNGRFFDEIIEGGM